MKYKQKQDIIALLATRCGLTRTVTEKVLNEYADIIGQELLNTGGVNLPEIGRAKMVHRAAVGKRQSVNPRTGTPMEIPAVEAKDVPRIKLGRIFMRRLEKMRTQNTAPATETA